MRVQVFSPVPAITKRLEELGIVYSLCPTPGDIKPDIVTLCDVASARIALMHDRTLLIMALSDMPSFTEGSELLGFGIKGYANTYIHALHLEQAYSVIGSGNVWLYPSFMQEMISMVAVSALPSNPSILESLTPRQQATALLVKQGKSNKEIASELNITERTVKAHLSTIFEKTGTSDRFALAMLLQQH